MQHSPRPALKSILILVVAGLLSACAGSGPTTQALDQRLIGVWTDEGESLHTITEQDGRYMISVVDADDEVFNVVSVSWDDGVLSWTYEVPSTGYRVHHVTTAISQDRLDVRWDNQTGASGDDVLTRVE